MPSHFESAAKFIAAAINCDPASLRSDSALAQHPAWDSVSHLDLMLLLEKEFGITIDDTSIEKYNRMSAIQKLFEHGR